LTNIYTEIISIGITIVILDRINEYRETQRLKKQLRRDAGSRSNTTALSAIDSMRHEGWLVGKSGLLEKQSLRRSNLDQSYLRYAQLYKTDLYRSSLVEADLIEADMKFSNLTHANLEGAWLYRTQLNGAELSYVNFEKARFGGVNFYGANLKHANLTNVGSWEGKKPPLVPLLPDGTQWTPDVDMEKFTNPAHPDYPATLKKINAIRTEMGIDPIT